ncbi:hypothetical protein CR513_33545, partial [Mucuna pruriens]
MLKPKGLLHAMPIPNNMWEDVFVDFIGGLPEAKGADSIMVVYLFLLLCLLFPFILVTNRPWKMIVIFSIKLCFDGSLDCYKSRLVALGYRHEFRVDYEETFTLITKMTTIWSILAIAASQCWSLNKMDVKNALECVSPW